MSVAADVQKSRNRKIKHPFGISFVILAIAVCVFCYRSQSDHQYKKLDYSRPVFTSDFAIICPRSILYDTRADHAIDAITDAFISFTSRDDKAKALGCEEWKGGIAVKAYRMSPPFDEFVAISPTGLETENLFTMEGNLTNTDSLDTSKESNPVSDHPSEEKNGFKTEGLPTVATTLSLADVEIKEYEESIADFRRKLPTLLKPSANLRWYAFYPVDPGRNKQEDLLLVTPFGSCANMLGNVSGYTVSSADISPYRPQVPMKILGNYQSRGEATRMAEQYCSIWYAKILREPYDSTRYQHMWFNPDSDPGNVGSPPETDAANKQTLPDALAFGATATSVAAPAPIVRAEPLQWETLSNGDQILSNSTRTCATLVLVPVLDPNGVRITFEDGTFQTFSTKNLVQARAAAIDHCMN